MSYIGNPPSQIAFLTDSFSGNGSTTAFTMSVAPAGTTSMLVAITGVLQDPSTYSVVGTTLTFSAAPPSGAGNISVRYMGIPASGVTTTAYRTVTEFTATAGQTTFSVPSYTVGYIDVYRNGSRLGTADFTATNGTTVVLAAAATSGDLIATESFYVSSVLNAIPATAGAVNSTYLTDSAVQTAKLDTAAVTQAKLAANVAGNGPAFSANTPVSKTVANNTVTEIAGYSSPNFDTASCFNVTTGRFTPNVAGYYQFSWSCDFGNNGIGAATVIGSSVYKNGTTQWNAGMQTGGTCYGSVGSSAIVYMNGSTDYASVYLFQNTGSTTPSFFARFAGALVRAA